MARRRKSLVRTIYKVMAIQFVLCLVAVIVIDVVVIGVIKFRNRIRPDTRQTEWPSPCKWLAEGKAWSEPFTR